VHHSGIPGNPVHNKGLGITMRKVALFAAVALAAVFANTSSAAFNPYAATSKVAAAPKAKKGKKKKA